MNRVIRILVGVLSSISLFFIYRFPNLLLLLIVLIVWLSGLVLIYLYMQRDSENKWEDLPSVITTSIALVALLSLVEWPPLIYFLIFLGGVVVALLFRNGGADSDMLPYLKKPIRRMIMMLWVFDAYALQTTLFAIAIFFTDIPFWAIVLLGSLLFVYVSFMIWRLYFSVPIKSFFLWLLIVGLIVSELIWIVGLLPFGYAVSGFVVTWFWYILQLFVRFHFSKQGIVWKSQRWFVLTNAVLMVVFFIFIFRWI